MHTWFVAGFDPSVIECAYVVCGVLYIDEECERASGDGALEPASENDTKGIRTPAGRAQWISSPSP